VRLVGRVSFQLLTFVGCVDLHSCNFVPCVLVVDVPVQSEKYLSHQVYASDKTGFNVKDVSAIVDVMLGHEGSVHSGCVRDGGCAMRVFAL
jgi:hypothetical protein